MLNSNKKIQKINDMFYISDIIECFEDLVPNSIILGGSCVNNENNIYICDEQSYFLSDIDLLCIREKPYTFDESKRIYTKMWNFSQHLEQSNPYFHIGLKLRGVRQLKEGVSSLYFRELSNNSISLLGNNFLSYFPKNTTFGINGNSNNIDSTLMSYALTRLWCNVLFFPIVLFKKPVKKYMIWYNYFYSRGCLDWIAFKLIKENRWVYGYKNRYKEWCRVERKNQSMIEKCLNTKLGVSNYDFRKIFEDGITMASDFYKELSSDISSETLFVLYMNKYIYQKTSNQHELSCRTLDEATNFFENFSKIRICSKNKNIELWNELRKEYSEFRFNRNYQDRCDHEVYTNNFLTLSSAI